MDGDVAGPHFQAFVQGAAEAVGGVLWQSGDEVHVYILEVIGPDQLHGLLRLRRRVAAADGGEDLVLHGLGVDGHPFDAVRFQYRQLLGGDGVRPSGLHGDLRTGGEVKGLLQGSQHRVHLRRRQGGGGAAAHVEGAGPQMVFPHHFSPGPDLRDEGLDVRLHQGEAPLHALAHKGAVGAAGGAEGDAHIQVDVPLFQPLPRLIAHGTSLQSQRRPLLRDEIARLQFPLGLLRGLALHQRPCDGFVGPDAGEHPPGGQRQLFRGAERFRQLGIQIQKCQIEAGRHGVAPLALFFKIRAGEGGCKGPGGGMPAIAKLRRDAALRRRLRGGKAAPRLIFRLYRVIGRFFQGEEGHQALFDDIALVMT